MGNRKEHAGRWKNLLILAIDTATSVSSIAVADDSKIIAEITVDNRLTHSETLVPHIEAAMKISEKSKDALDGIAVSIGPGSFTGLRIGLGTAKGLSYALKCPIVGVPTLEALAYHFPVPGVYTAAFADAQKGNVYFGLYSFKEGNIIEVKPVQVLPFAEAVSYCGTLDAPVMMAGDIFRKKSAKKVSLPENCDKAPSNLLLPRAANVALLGMRMLSEGKKGNVMDMEPIYIRKSEAEVLWDRRHPETAAKSEPSSIMIDAISGERGVRND